MSDAERMDRLTALARRVWPDRPRLRVRLHSDPVSAEVQDGPKDGGWIDSLLLIVNHPRALDALEAALLVLAGEPPAWVAKLCAQWEYEADALMQRVADSPDDPSPPLRTTAATMYVYAAELCERAKKESR